MSIQIKHVHKHYKEVHALKDINLEIHNGMFGLLGPNGAGKTTLMRLLMGLHTSNSGEITIEGLSISNRREIRKMVSYLPQEYSFYPSFTVYEAMDYIALLNNIKDASERKEIILTLLKKVNLITETRKKVKALSGGMKRRLGIAQSLIKDPKVLIVDEPTAGLDPEERIRIRNLLTDFSKERTVILSTHIVEDIAFSCDKLAVIDEGCLLFSGRTNDFIKKAENVIWTVSINRDNVDYLREKHHVISMFPDGEQYKARIIDLDSKHNNQESPTLEDAYMLLMIQQKREEAV